MYYFLYTSSDYYDKNIILDKNADVSTNNNNFNNNNICLICWLPSNNQNKTKYMKDFLQFETSCDCNPSFHDNCFNNWISRSSSCPICRKTIILNQQQPMSVKISTYYTFFYYCTARILHAATCISFLNLCSLCVYNFYFIFYVNRQIDDNEYYT